MKYAVLMLIIFTFNLAGSAQGEIVAFADNAGLVGGTQNGKWLTDEQVVKSIGKGSKFINFGLPEKKQKEIYGTIADLAGCGKYYFFFAQSPKTAMPAAENVYNKSLKFNGLAISANAKWNLFPRNQVNIGTNNKTYQKIVSDFLIGKGFIKPKINLKKVVKVDIEGDGADEIFIEATYSKNQNRDRKNWVNAGDYSFVLMRKLINGKPQDILINGDFYPKVPAQEDYVSYYELTAIVDLNGDGKMEIAIGGLYTYGGESTEIYEISDNKLTSVLSSECGD